MDADEVRDDAECRQGNNINLGVTEEPEQVLEQKRITTNMVGLVAHGHDRGHKEARAEQNIQRHHDRAHKECRKGKQRKNGGNENTPDGERHAHQGHAPGSRLKNRDHVVQAAHRKANDENRQRRQH